MPVIKITRDEAFDLCCDAVEMRIVDQGRWTTFKDYVIAKDGKYYTYGLDWPSTENSGDAEDMNDSEIELVEVHQVEKLVKVWENV